MSLPPPNPPPRFSSSAPPPAPPPPPPESPEPELPRGVVWGAIGALAGYSVLTWLALGAYFSAATDPFTWKSMVALLSAAVAMTAAILFWRVPSRPYAVLGMGAMLLSLARIGLDFNWKAVLLIVITLLLMVPVGRAAVVLKS